MRIAILHPTFIGEWQLDQVYVQGINPEGIGAFSLFPMSNLVF